MATNFESIKLNFKSSAYSTAVTQLESKMKELESARSEYDQRRSEIPQFWDGDARDEAYKHGRHHGRGDRQHRYALYHRPVSTCLDDQKA